jgi:outer membrane protein assembly factor BamB
MMRHTACLVAAVAAYSVLGTQSSAAADWTQFRGANGSAVSTETNLPSGFSDTSGLRWKATLPGRGVSSPVIAGGRVYLTCSNGAKDDRLHVVCIDAATGGQLWHRQLVATGSTACHPKTCMAAPTPVADESGVYALFATGDVAAFDRDGNQRWYRSLVGDYPKLSNQVGMAASPVLYKDKLIVPMDNTGDSFLAALDTRTGKNLWKVERPRDINWVSPLLRTANGKTEVIFPATKSLIAYDLETGEKRWSSTNPTNGIPTPTLMGDMLILPARGVVALNLKGEKPAEAWTSTKLSSGMSSPLVYDGRVYTGNPAGIVVCADAKTGKVIWEERLKGPFSGSPIAGDGKVYFINEAGVLTTLKAGDTFEILAESKTGEEGLATPAVSGGAIFLRGEQTLFCVGQK